MEGGSPALIWERWTLPMYYAQMRYWSDHPRLEWMVAAYLKIKPRKTPPRQKQDRAVPTMTKAALDAPLTPAEIAAASGSPPYDVPLATIRTALQFTDAAKGTSKIHCSSQ